MRAKIRHIMTVVLLLCSMAVGAQNSAVMRVENSTATGPKNNAATRVENSTATGAQNNTATGTKNNAATRAENNAVHPIQERHEKIHVAIPDSTSSANNATPTTDTNSKDSTDTKDLTVSKDGIHSLDSSLFKSGKGAIDSIPSYRRKKSELAGPVHYQSNDSMVMTQDGNAYLHGKGELKYMSLELESEYIRMNIDSSQIYARGVYDSVNYEWTGKPIFNDGTDKYETDEITYNIKTQKGYIRHVVTQQGEGYIIADKTKKLDNDELMMAGGQYTTCDDHEHPHFYLKMTKAKVKPGHYIATGPAYMVVGEVPLPLAVPFGFFPFTDKYSSGLIMPNFGDDYTRGLYLNNLGYYFAICDYLDLEVTGDIYTKGTWAIRGNMKYIWRYHFSGNLNISYRNDVTSERGLPDHAVNRNFQIQWSHSQDSKFNPYSTFSASVNFSTSGYSRSNINNYYNSQLLSENTRSSTISYTQRFPDSPWSLSMTASLTQRTKDSTLSLTAPQLSVSMSSIYPFKEIRQKVLKRKGKVGAGKEKWYEKIKISYNMDGRIAANNMKESYLPHSNFLRDWQTGLRHTLPINASFMLFKYVSVTPNINMTDRMYFQRIDRTWNQAENQLQMDTTTGFYNVFDFNVGLSLSTKIYGFYTPLKKLFPNSKVEKFRHVITPRVSMSYHPDFSTSGWGYYGRYEEPVVKGGDTTYVERVYSRFANGMYGNAPSGTAATLSFGVANNLEMKVVNKQDTTGKNPYKVVSLIDNFSIDGGYNFAADSMNWSLFQVNLRLKFPRLNNYSLNLSTALDPYMYQLDSNGRPVRTNKQYWHNGRFPHWSGFRWSFSYTISNQTIKKWRDSIAKRRGEKVESPPSSSTSSNVNLSSIERNEDGTDKNAKLQSKKEEETDDGYVKTEFPWSLSLNYSLAYVAGSTFDYEKMYYKMQFTNNLSLSGSIGLGKGWKVSASMSYDFDCMRVTSCNINISRDLHCWNMTASINPIGPYKSYTFHIGVNASILSDLKYDTNSNQSTNGRVNWW